MGSETRSTAVPKGKRIRREWPFVVIALSWVFNIGLWGAPTNDNFAMSSVLEGTAVMVHGSNVEATKEEGEGEHAGNGGAASVWWHWTALTDGTVTLTTLGSSFDTLLAVYRGDDILSLARVAGNDDGGPDHSSQVTFDAFAGMTYRIAVDGWNRATGEVVLNLTVDFIPPTIVLHPTTTSVFSQEYAYFSLEVIGTKPLVIQWRKNGIAIPGETTALSLAPDHPDRAGTYSVFVSNAYGAAISSNAVLTVLPSPPNDNYAQATPIDGGLPYTGYGSNVGASQEDVDRRAAGKSVWWSWTAPRSGAVVVDTTGSTFDTVIAVFQDSETGPIFLESDDQSGGYETSRLEFETTAGVSYHFEVDGVSSMVFPATRVGEIVLHLDVLERPENDLFSEAISVSGEEINVSGNNVGAGVESGEPSIAPNAGNHTVWWRWTAETNGWVWIDISGSSFNAIFSVYAGNYLNELSSVSINRVENGYLRRGYFEATASTPYLIAVDGIGDGTDNGDLLSREQGLIQLSIRQPRLSAPEIWEEPQSRTVSVGEVIDLHIRAFGNPFPTFQWRLNGQNLVTATNEMLRLSVGGIVDAGDYDVVVGNLHGVATSAVARVTVSTPTVLSFLSSWPGSRSGSANDIELAGNFAYVATDAGLVVLDVSLDGKPRRVGEYLTDSRATRVEYKDGFVYLLTSSNDFRGSTISRIDVRNPAIPKKVRENITEGNEVALVGEYLYTVSDKFINVLNLDGVLLGSYETINAENQFGGAQIVGEGERLYVCWNNFIGIYSLSNPTMPSLIGLLSEYSTRIAILDGRLFGAFGNGGFVRFWIADTRDASAPKIIGKMETTRLGWGNVSGLLAQEKRVFIVETDYSGQAFGVIDTTTPWAPSLIDSAVVSVGAPKMVTGSGKRALIADGNAGVKILNVETNGHFTQESRYHTSLRADGLCFQGNIAYVLDFNIGFHIVDVSNILFPEYITSYESERPPGAFALLGRYILLAIDAPLRRVSALGAPSLEIIDISDTRAPIRVAIIDLPQRLGGPDYPTKIASIGVRGHSGIIETYNGFAPWGMLGIFDLLDPRQPRVMARIDLGSPSLVSRIEFEGDYAFLADRHSGLRVLSFIDPGRSQIVSNYRYPSERFTDKVTSGLAHEGRYFLSGADGTHVLDIRNPLIPVLLGTNEFTGKMMLVEGDIAVGADTSGLSVFDLGAFPAPQVLGKVNGVSGDVAVHGSHVYVTSGESGMTIFDLGAAFGKPPNILEQPHEARVVRATTTNLFAAVSGTPPLSYQWYFNGAEIAGANDELLRLADIQNVNEGKYSVAVSNAFGRVVSDEVVVVIDPEPIVEFVSPRPYEAVIPGDFQVKAKATDDRTVVELKILEGTNVVAFSTNGICSGELRGLTEGKYRFRAIAKDDEGAESEPAMVELVVTNQPVFQFSATNYIAAEETNGVAVIEILRNSSGAAWVEVQTESVSARAVEEGGVGHYSSVSRRVEFALNERSKKIWINLVDDLVYRGTNIFLVRLSKQSEGWTTAYPEEARVAIIDNDPRDTTNSLFDIFFPTNILSGRAELSIEIDPPEGRWRLPWEFAWRRSGTVALEPGEYSIVFKEIDGWRTPTSDLSFRVGTGPQTPKTYRYKPIDASEQKRGVLRVTIEPLDIARTNVVDAKGQWRLLEEPPSGNWLSSEEQLELPVGYHVVEFKQITGSYSPPPALAFQVLPGESGYKVEYQPVETSPGEAPQVLQSYGIVRSTNSPYGFVGQILAEGNYGTGFLVKDRVVLTAAHVLFDRSTLSYSSNVWWSFQKHSPEHEPVPKQPMGWYAFSAYAAGQTNNVERRNYDVAAMFFTPHEGARGGYLTHTEGRDWLSSSESQKVLIGYPMEIVPVNQRGRMHETGPRYFQFERIIGTALYRSQDLKGYGGMSGGPLCIEVPITPTRSFYLPAGIYLGGVEETIVRAIDLDVVDLIRRAYDSSAVGGDHGGGGVVLFRSSANRELDLGVRIEPPEVLNLAPGWRLNTNGSFLGTNQFEIVSKEMTNLVIDFKPIAGWKKPEGTVELPAGAAYYVYTGRYVKKEEAHLRITFTNSTFTATLSGDDGKMQLEYRDTFSGGDLWRPVESGEISTNSIGVNLPPNPGGQHRFYRAVWLSD
jgi:hypothetical protein